MSERPVDWLNTAEIAQHLAVHHRTVLRMIEVGLPAHRIVDGGPWRFDPLEVDAWVKQRRTQSAA